MRPFVLCGFFSAVLAACGPATIDPPSYMRNGDDVASVPLSGGTLAVCVELCCNYSGCVAFSFNDPQPEKACVGAECCAVNGQCCMLKSGNGTMVPNPWPGVVTTGTVPPPVPLPGPIPPFPWSTVIRNVSFGPVGWWGGSGDTWPTAWAANNASYGWACDNALNSPMSLYRLDGSPSTVVTPTLVGQAQPLNYTHLCAAYAPTGLFPHVNIKPAGMAAFADGTLRVGVSCMNYGDDAVFNRQHNIAGFIAASTDFGLTWHNVTPVGGVFTGRFAAPVLVSCGRANEPCDALDNGAVYVFFPGAFDDAAYWDNNDYYLLARTPNASAVDTPVLYEYYAGLTADGAPIWTADSLQAQPVFSYGRMLGESAVFYHPALGRYVMANFGFIDELGQPRPWHQEPYQTPHRTQLLMLEAPHPWGPWSVFYQSDDSPPAPGLYTPTFPSAWMAPTCESDPKQCVLGMAWSCLQGATSCRYTLNYQTVTFTLF